jgi:hypothetical protein
VRERALCTPAALIQFFCPQEILSFSLSGICAPARCVIIMQNMCLPGGILTESERAANINDGPRAHHKHSASVCRV